MHYFYYLATNYGINFWVFFTAQKKKKNLLKNITFFLQNWRVILDQALEQVEGKNWRGYLKTIICYIIVVVVVSDLKKRKNTFSRKKI